MLGRSRSSKDLIAYSEQCWICDLGRRKLCYGAERCGFSHSEFCAAKVLLKVEREKSSDIDIRSGQRMPHSLVLSRLYYTFYSWLLTIEMSYQTQSYNKYLKITGLELTIERHPPP